MTLTLGEYQEGILHVDGCSLEAIAAEHGTPCYVYSARKLRQNFERVDRAMSFARHLVAYAVKANSNLHILRTIGSWGAGADVVSGGELARALRAGIPASRIVFSGVGKTDDEIVFALREKVRSLHVESAQELEAIERLASEHGLVADIALRVNPDVNPVTHPYIATGLSTSKFGIDLKTADLLIEHIGRSQHLRLHGVATHIGSQLGDPESLEEAVAIVAAFARHCETQGHKLQHLDVGGGWPVNYGDETQAAPALEAYARAISKGLTRGCALAVPWEIVIEPGRVIVADAGILLTRVLYKKQQTAKMFAVIDAAMTELIRPALYQAYHPIELVGKPSADAKQEVVDVVGPVCESGDFLAQNRTLPQLRRGDLLAIGCAGAYSASMGSNYNSRCRPSEIWVDNKVTQVIRRRESVEELWALEE